MDIVDGIIICTTFLSALLGFSRGFAREVLTFVSLICGAALTIISRPFIYNIIHNYIQNENICQIASIVCLFVLFFILFNITNQVFSGLVKNSILGTVDRSLGFFFGIARGSFLLSALQLTASCIMPISNYPTIIQDNRFMPLIYRGSNVIKEITPKELRKIINDEQLKNNNINDPILKNNKNSEKLNENLQEIENEIKSFIPDIDHKNTINEPHNKIVSENSTTGKPPEGSLESAQAQAEQMARLEPRTIHSSTKEEKIEAEMDRLFNNPNDDQSHQIDHESIEEESH